MTGRFSLETGDQKHYSHAENRAAGVTANINAEAYSMALHSFSLVRQLELTDVHTQ